MHVGLVSGCSSGPLADLLPESGGVDLGCGAYFMATLVRAVIGRGHEVSVITLSRDITERRILRGPKLTYYVYPMRSGKRMRDLYKFEREGLREGISLAKPDLLHAHWTYEFALACLDSGLPTLVTSHDNAFQVLRFRPDLFRLGQAYLQLRVIRNARFMTAVSPYIASSHRRLARKEIEVVPNPVEIPQNRESQNKLDLERIRIATVLNGWGSLKNPKTAIRAFANFRRAIPDAEMVMYGTDFGEGEIASRWATANGLTRNIEFRGFLPRHDLQSELSKMTMLLHPSVEEACPLALLEAMALGVPIVAHATAGGVPWVLDNGQAGFLTDMRDVEQVAATMLDCITNAELREEKQRSAYHRVVNCFSPPKVAEQYDNMYSKVLLSR